MTSYALSPGYRLQYEEAQGRHVLLYPEGMVELSDTAADILACCQRPTTLDGVLAALSETYESDDEMRDDVRAFLEAAHARGWVKHD